MRFTAAALAAVLTMGGTAFAQVSAPPVGTIQQPPPGTPGTAPGTQAPGTQVPATQAPVVPAPVVPPVPLGARVFTGKSGLIFNAVRPDRVVDFEMVIGYLQAAFEKSNDARVQEQAKGWRVFKATEPGPNGSVLYVFVIDPAIPGADYGLGRILADAYPDQIEKIWSLYTRFAGERRQPAESDARAAAGDVAHAALVSAVSAARCGAASRAARSTLMVAGGLQASGSEREIDPRVDAVHDRVERFAAQLEQAVIESRPERSQQRDLRAAARVEADMRFL